MLSDTVPIVVRTRYRGEADTLVRLGATIAVAEELEASLEVLAQLLARLDIPGNVIEVLLGVFRGESTAIRPLRAPTSRLETLPTDIRQTPVATHQLHDGDWAVGRTLAETDLRAATGASVLALRRDSLPIAAPPTDMRLDAGDVLYLVGDDSDVLLARQRLSSGS
jgi:CPA2 family monovalent cation:H+ antiporter-2